MKMEQRGFLGLTRLQEIRIKNIQQILRTKL